VIAGPLKDTSFALSSAETPVGRDPSNLFSISDPSLSRKHCILTQNAGIYHIRDLESRNGTFVNGVAVRQSALQHGDQISAGDSVFIFLLQEDGEEPSSGLVEFEDSLTHATSQIRPQDVLYLQPDRILSELPATSRLGRNLAALLKVARIVHAIRDFEGLQAKILSLILEVAPAERGAILLDPTSPEQFSSVFARHRRGSTSQPVRVSRTITRRVVEQGVAILGADVPASGGLKAVDSLVNSNVRSLLCVPLMLFDKVIGCIYLDTTSAAGRFDEEHLQLVTGIASISSVALDNARRVEWLEQENLRLTTEINQENNMVGESPRMKEVYQFLTRVASKDATVLIQGESGTGKELVARAIHRSSPRSKQPFVPINCAAIPEGLLESELFGHEKGAFTGAIAAKKGKLELANGGVVFLDEIGEMPLLLQVKLLRVLQEREFERLGGTRSICVDIRLIAATNRELEEAVKEGKFRQDLYYRLNVVSLVMPPLRERREDIPMLAEHFVTKYSKKCKIKPKPIAAETMACLVNHEWPGNVRELENAIERALVLSVTDDLQPEDLPESFLEKNPPGGIAAAKYHNAVKELKKQLILNALEETRGNFTEAARGLGVHPNYLHRLIRNLDLRDSLRSAPNPPRPSGKNPGQRL
jgi:Nif-specific regulatory protein